MAQLKSHKTLISTSAKLFLLQGNPKCSDLVVLSRVLYFTIICRSGYLPKKTLLVLVTVYDGIV